MTPRSSALLSLAGEGREGALRGPRNEETKITESTALVWLLVQITMDLTVPTLFESYLGASRSGISSFAENALFLVDIIEKKKKQR